MSIYELSLISTVVMGLAALASAFAAAMSARTAKRAFEKQASPEVIVYIDNAPNGSLVAYMYVENIGNAPAHDVSFEVDGRICMSDVSAEVLQRGHFGNGIPFFQPGGKRQTALEPFRDFTRDMGESTAKVKVSYYSRPEKEGKRFEAVFPIEGMSFLGDMLDEPKDVLQLKKIAKALEAMKRR
ncbi:hypothetical protein [Gordonibacter urolithinfaciens]|uniref:hypothetical protein n=1 Tax=Gordonibacter urolithinfaciens TaxID=1335613 RepID=UPI003AAFA1CA